MSRHLLNTHAGGWRPSLPDMRDQVANHSGIKVLPEVDPRPDMPAVYDQGQLGCHDDQTEVLTVDGWERWSDYDGAALLGTVNPSTRRLEYQAPTALHAYDYSGPLRYTDHKSLDLAVTPNHRMWVRPWIQRDRTLSGNFEFREMQDIGWYSGLLAAPVGYDGVALERLRIGDREYTGDDLLALIALVASDGWVGGTANNWNTVSFCCFREDRYDMVATLAQRIGVHEVPSRKGVWKFTDAALASWMRANLYVGDVLRSPFKRVPSIVKAASQHQIEHFLSFYGDQHAGKGWQFYTSSGAMADDLQHLLLQVGRRSGIYERAPRSTQMKDGRRIEAENCTRDITLSVWDGDSLSLARKGQVVQESYSGAVYCATVPNGLLVTRRNGTVLVSGNSCTANAVGAAIEYDRRLNTDSGDDYTPSRLDIYYGERLLEHSPADEDTGAYGRDGFRWAHTKGVIPEADWPYDIGRFAEQPPQDLANRHKIGSYKAVTRSVNAFKAVLSNRQTVAVGFTVYESFDTDEVARTGVVPIPQHGESVLGGHEVLVVGYLRSEPNYALTRNSWGEGWALSGYFLFPWAILMDRNMSSDFRTVYRPAGT